MSRHTCRMTADKLSPEMRIYLGNPVGKRHPDQYQSIQEIDRKDDFLIVYFVSGKVKSYNIKDQVLVMKVSVNV